MLNNIRVGRTMKLSINNGKVKLNKKLAGFKKDNGWTADLFDVTSMINRELFRVNLYKPSGALNTQKDFKTEKMAREFLDEAGYKKV